MFKPRFSLKTLLAVFTGMAALATFCYLREQPRVVAERFGAHVANGELDEAAAMILDQTRLEEARQQGFALKSMRSFSQEDPGLSDWLVGRRTGRLELSVGGSYQSADGLISGAQDWICTLEITRHGLRFMEVGEFDPAFAIVPVMPEKSPDTKPEVPFEDQAAPNTPR